MRTGKLALSLALAGILGATVAVAEEEGAYAGVQLGYGWTKHKFSSGSKITPAALRYGITGGYKQFLDENLGLRYYGVFDYGSGKKSTKSNGKATVTTWNFNVNADALYNFMSMDDMEFGAFGGLSLGYANHKTKLGGGGKIKASGFDAGINFGLRANFAAQHGVEIYNRVSFLTQKKNNNKYSQPYNIGLRYTFSF